MDELKKFRKKIDRVDKKILKLLSERINVVKNIKAYKRKNNLKVINLKREEEVYKSLQKESKKLGLNKEYTKELFKLIIKNSRKSQIS